MKTKRRPKILMLVKKGLRTCSTDKSCNWCPYYREHSCIETLMSDALCQLQKLEHWTMEEVEDDEEF